MKFTYRDKKRKKERTEKSKAKNNLTFPDTCINNCYKTKINNLNKTLNKLIDITILPNFPFFYGVNSFNQNIFMNLDIRKNLVEKENCFSLLNTIKKSMNINFKFVL